MSCIPEFYLYCDGEGCTRKGEAFEGHSLDEPRLQRRSAKAAGWRRPRIKGGYLIDLCPACVAATTTPSKRSTP